METTGIPTPGGIDPRHRFGALKRPADRKSSRKEGDGESAPTASASGAPKDKVTWSSAVHQSRLDQVKEKLKQGFYDSETVREAVSDKLTGLFEEKDE